MPGRPVTLPWNFALFSGNEPVTTLSDNFSALQNGINDSGAGWVNYAVDTGTTNNCIVALVPPPVAYEPGMMVVIKPANTNTGASVINVNALGNVPIVNPAGKSLVGGELPANAAIPLVYDGSSFRIIGFCPSAITLGGKGGNVPIECAGATSLSAFITWTIAGTASVTLNHLAVGVPVNIVAVNGTGSSFSFLMTATDPGGNAFTLVDAITGSQFFNLLVGITFGVSGALKFTGTAIGSSSLFLSF